MEYTEILKMVDHTLLKQDATWEEIKSICDDGMRYSTASVCIPASYVKQAAEYVCGKVPICTVIGFPNGYSTTATKLFETQDAIKNGADEIDMVINIGWLKDKKYDDILAEIKAIKAVCSEKILKVIIETCLLTNEEKIKMCEIVSLSGADFIKTSTGFSTGGATAADIQLFANHVAPHVKIKAAGGISYISDAENFIELGASRLGTSKLVKLLAEGKHPVGEIIKWINDDYLRYSSSQNNPSYAFARLWEDIALECYAEDDIDEEIIMYNLVTAKLNLDKGSIINGTRYSIPKVMSYYEKMKDRIRAYYSQEDNKIIDDMVAEIYSKRNLWEK